MKSNNTNERCEMKKIKKLLGILVFTIFVMAMSMTVFAEDYDLKSLSVTDQDGNEIILSPKFSADVLVYEGTAHYGTKKVKLDYETELDSASVTTWNEALDPGDNQTFIKVTANGESQTYEIDIYVLSEEEEETYVVEEPEDVVDEDGAEEDPLTAKVGDETYYVVNSTSKLEIPDGFVESTYDYEDKTIAVIKHEENDIIAFCLTNEAGDDIDWFLYDTENEDIYRLKNLSIKKRTYTFINYAKALDALNSYDKETIAIGDVEVDAWLLDSEEGFYLLYAMNWQGETNLYRYDMVEQNLQRYPESLLTSEIFKEADETINELQTKYNELVSKYNNNNSLKWKIIAGLAIVIIILFFVALNLILKIKDITSEDYEEEYDEDDEQTELGYYETIDFNQKNNSIIEESKTKAEEDLAAGVAEVMKEFEESDKVEKAEEKSEEDDSEEDEDFEFID